MPVPTTTNLFSSWSAATVHLDICASKLKDKTPLVKLLADRTIEFIHLRHVLCSTNRSVVEQANLDLNAARLRLHQLEGSLRDEAEESAVLRNRGSASSALDEWNAANLQLDALANSMEDMSLLITLVHTKSLELEFIRDAESAMRDLHDTRSDLHRLEAELKDQ